MPRILAMFLALIIAVGCPGPTVAQLAGQDSATLTLRKQENPLIDDVARNDPDGLRELLSKLEFLIANRGSPARTGSRPTPAEAAEIAANPAVGRAYQNNPDETLVLLRETNEALRKARLGAELGKPRRLALVVGDSGNEVWGRLDNAANDADLIARTLKTLDFDLVTGGPLIDADRRHLQQAVRDFGHSIGSETVAVFYFAGHGAQFRGNNYLVPHEAGLPRSADDYDRNLLGVSDTVLRQMRQASGRLNIVVLDACRDHPPLQGFDIAGRGGSQGGGLAANALPPGMNGTVIIYSTAPGEIARDRVNDWDSHSPFAAAFAGAVVRPGIEVRDTFEEIQEKVKEATKDAQQPWISYAAIGKFAFSGRLEVQDSASRILMPNSLPGAPPSFAPAPPPLIAPYVIPPPSPHVVDRYVELKPGVSTLDDAKKLFGEPNSETPLTEGKVGIQWHWNNFDFIAIIFDRNKRMLRIYNRNRSNI